MLQWFYEQKHGFHPNIRQKSSENANHFRNGYQGCLCSRVI